MEGENSVVDPNEPNASPEPEGIGVPAEEGVDVSETAGLQSPATPEPEPVAQPAVTANDHGPTPTPPPPPEPAPGYTPPPPPPPQGEYQPPPAPSGGSDKNKVLAGLLGILLGELGIHKFYLGYTKEGLIMLAVTILSFGLLSWIPWAIGIIEGITYLTKTDEEFRQTYVSGNKPWF